MGATKGALLGGVSSGLLGVGLYFLGKLAGATFIPKDPASAGMAVLEPFMPLVIAIIASLVASGVFALLVKFAPSRAWPSFLGIAAVVFVFEGVMSLLVFADVPTVVTLEIMHVPVALGIMFGIRRGGFPQS